MLHQFFLLVQLCLHQAAFEGIMPGSIGLEALGDNGFGYDPIFVPKGYNLSYAQMDLETKNTLSHRGQALRKAVDFLEKGSYEK